MAAINTFEWFVKQTWPNPDPETQRFIDGQRDQILKIRNENERLRYIEELVHSTRETKGKRA